MTMARLIACFVFALLSDNIVVSCAPNSFSLLCGFCKCMWLVTCFRVVGWQDLDTDFSAESVKFEFGCPQWCRDFCNYVQMDGAGGGRRMEFNEVFICALQF